MLKLNNSTHGFSILETILIIGTVIIVIAIGGFVYSRYDRSNATIILQRQQYIDKYISHLSIENYANLGSLLYKSGYLTTSLYHTTQSLTNSYSEGSLSSNPSYGAIICVDQIPRSYAYGQVNVNNSATTATVPVKVFVFGSFTATSYTAYWENTNGLWQLNTVKCS